MSTEPHHTATERAETSIGGKFLTFWLGDDEYGVEILRVREIIGLPSFCPLLLSRHHHCRP